MKHKWDQVKIFILPVIRDNLDLTTLSEADRGNPLTENEVVYALILTFHPEVLKDIQIVIDKIELKKFIQYPKIRNIDNLIKIATGLSLNTLEKRIILQQEVEKLLKKYQLTDNWSLPLKIKILTNVLPVPSHQEFEFVNTGINTSMLNIMDYPAHITIKSKLDSKTRLINWIDKNFNKVIYPVTSKLTEVKFTKTSVSALALGLVFWRINSNKNKWEKAEDFISEIEDKDESFFDINGEKTPDRTELMRLVDNSVKILRKFYFF